MCASCAASDEDTQRKKRQRHRGLFCCPAAPGTVRYQTVANIKPQTTHPRNSSIHQCARNPNILHPSFVLLLSSPRSRPNALHTALPTVASFVQADQPNPLPQPFLRRHTDRLVTQALAATNAPALGLVDFLPPQAPPFALVSYCQSCLQWNPSRRQRGRVADGRTSKPRFCKN